jgi:Cyclin-dependent kinase inhibitor 3 (CDKN3)
LCFFSGSSRKLLSRRASHRASNPAYGALPETPLCSSSQDGISNLAPALETWRPWGKEKMTFNIVHFWIASLVAGRTRGRIGMAACPGWAPRSPLEGSAARDFEQDMSAIVRWGPHLVLTLLENDELWEYRVGMLPQTLAAHGIAYQHFPMARDGLPDESFEQRWALVSPGLRDMLRAGGRLLVHCSDGMLRSGLLAGRLLVELDCRPEDALNRVQAVRAGALTAPEQRNYLLHQVQVPRADLALPALHPDLARALSAAPTSAAAHVVQALAEHAKPAHAWRSQQESSSLVDLAKYRQSR